MHRNREVIDVVPSTAWAQRISVSPDAVVDITVPSGVTWTRIGAVGSDIVTYGFSGGYRDIVVQAVPRTFGDPATPTATHAHGPIADPVRRYAHRVLRDLELRYPTSAQVSDSRGTHQKFQGGELWALGSGTPRMVHGSVLEQWKAAGGASGSYGYPLTETVESGGRTTCQFEGGTISA